ncbi:hypothetical protein FHW58_005173 [Duganella sp. 1224]|uniref:hypothetical protein n=1 Tax=Duganella sp. 1224 TaxID=2587052 RepID=UPI0015CABA69|nr:hypothetical protein [Duganella sp. 1224]NYE63939.1 hypothetical protein [Duganella sp. 1224]
MMNKVSATLAAAGGLLMLAGCGSVVRVDEVTADKMGYLNKKFPASSLSQAITAKLPATGNGELGFRQLVIKFDGSDEDSTGKKESWQRTITYVNQGNGLTQQISEGSSNGIAFGLDYTLSYRGLFGFKWQTVPLRGTLTSMIYEVKEVSRLDPIPAVAGQSFEFAYTSGTEQQIAGYHASKRECKTTGSRPASDIYAKLSGQALTFDCDTISNNTVQSRSKWALLPGYGIAVILESTTSARKAVFRVVDIQG